MFLPCLLPRRRIRNALSGTVSEGDCTQIRVQGCSIACPALPKLRAESKRQSKRLPLLRDLGMNVYRSGSLNSRVPQCCLAFWLDWGGLDSGALDWRKLDWESSTGEGTTLVVPQSISKQSALAAGVERVPHSIAFFANEWAFRAFSSDACTCLEKRSLMTFMTTDGSPTSGSVMRRENVRA
jgi:hypothetical protein